MSGHSLGYKRGGRRKYAITKLSTNFDSVHLLPESEHRFNHGSVGKLGSSAPVLCFHLNIWDQSFYHYTLQVSKFVLVSCAWKQPHQLQITSEIIMDCWLHCTDLTCDFIQAKLSCESVADPMLLDNVESLSFEFGNNYLFIQEINKRIAVKTSSQTGVREIIGIGIWQI